MKHRRVDMNAVKHALCLLVASGICTVVTFGMVSSFDWVGLLFAVPVGVCLGINAAQVGEYWSE
jgi:hypothetical protein